MSEVTAIRAPTMDELRLALLAKHRAAEFMRKAEARLLELRYRLTETEAREIGVLIKQALQSCDD